MAHLIVNVAWSSSNWTQPATEEDLAGANFGFVQEHGRMHEELNFALGRATKKGRKYAYATLKGTPRWFERGGLVFFHSKRPDGDGFRIVGCFGGVKLNPDGWQAEADLTCNIRAPLELCVPFPPEAHIVRDSSRHIEGAKRVSQGGMNYISGPTARRILLDAKTAFEAAGHDTAPLDRLLALLRPDDERHPAWVLGPFRGDARAYARGGFDRLVRWEGATSWWSWGLATSHGALRRELTAEGFRVGLTQNNQVVAYYDVAPGGVVDQWTEGLGGQQVPCPWPHLAGADRVLPSDPEDSRTRRLWFRIVRAGVLDPPLPVSSFRSATGKTRVAMTQKGFRYAFPPKEASGEPLRYDPRFEAAVSKLFDRLRDRWGAASLREKLCGPGTEAGHRVEAYPRYTQALRARPLDMDVLRTLHIESKGGLWPATAMTERMGIPAFLAHPDAEAAIVDLIEERDSMEAWAQAIDRFVEAVVSMGYGGGPASRALCASILLSAAWPDRFVDLRRSHFQSLVTVLELKEELPRGYGELIVWAGGFARHLVRCPSWPAALGTDALTTVAGLARLKLDKELPVDASTQETRDRIERLRRLLDEKGQIILYGPPGTGKTWLARQLPEDEDTTVLMTFHPATAYEEFVEGIRPVLDEEVGEGGQVRYTRRDGIFLDLCRRADAEPERLFTLIIDEINRANIAAVLGELITLLERDKRDWLTEDQQSQRFARGEHPVTVTLPYSGERFSVPPNVQVVGTMNTADRSISLVDVALRRRFRFVEVRPDPRLIGRPDAVGGVAAESAEVRALLVRVQHLLEALNVQIAARRGRDYCLGHSYLLPLRRCVDEGGFLARFADIWQGELQPLLAEYFYEDWETLCELLGEELIETVRPNNEPVHLGFRKLGGGTLLHRLEVALGLAKAGGEEA